MTIHRARHESWLAEIKRLEGEMDNIKTKALSVIEGLTLGDFSPDEKILQACYRFSHVALGRCQNPHTDWLDELDSTYRALVDGGIIDATRES